jgi:2-polyprenyl-3-methyl-5-hydroxy-6-metoxy-1,4-benzoquinol methylase
MRIRNRDGNPNDRTVPAGNVYPKYAARNPIARALVAGFERAFDELVDLTAPTDVHEIGCGECHLLRRIARRHTAAVRGSDVSKRIVEVARTQNAAAGFEFPLSATGIDDLRPPRDSAALVICCEVIEHLPNPEQAIERLASLSRPWLLASVPREPMWRVLNLMRAAYFSSLGNTPGHVNHFSTRGFLDLLRTHFDVVEVRKPPPWTMALCRVRRKS